MNRGQREANFTFPLHRQENRYVSTEERDHHKRDEPRVACGSRGGGMSGTFATRSFSYSSLRGPLSIAHRTL
jgi:hypothetical protein